MDSAKKEIIKNFFAKKVIEVSLEKPFVLASGLVAPVYIDHRRIFSWPDLRKMVAKAWKEFLQPHLKNSKVTFAGTATAGIAPAYALAEEFGGHFVYVRSKNKEHGTGKAIEGDFDRELPVVVVDDMVTTGGSLLRAVDTLNESGATVLFATSVTTHNFPSTHDRFGARETTLKSLFTTAEIFDTALHEGLISREGFRTVMEWMARSEH